MSANTDYVLLSHQTSSDRQFAVLAGDLSLSMLPGAQQNKLFFKQFVDRQGQNPVSFVEDLGTYRNLSTGDITSTGYALDFAIIGQGYFKILTPDGVRYGRNGRAHMGPNREIMIGADGIMLKDDDSPLILPAGSNMEDLHVSPDLAITIGNEYAGKLGVARFEDEQKLTYLKTRHLYETDQEALPPTDDQGKLLVEVQQGSYEKANINSASVLFEYMEIHRNYTAIDDFMKKRHTAEIETVKSWLKTSA